MAEKMASVTDQDLPPRAGSLVLNDVMPKLDKWWFQYSHLRMLNFYLLAGILTEATTGFDGSMMNGLQSLTQWSDYFGNPTGVRLGTMVNGVMFGTVISLLVASWLAEKLGRRWPIFIGSITILIGTILQAAAQNFGMFIAARWCIGFGLGLLQATSTLLLSEVAYPAHRGKITAIFEPTWPLGALVAAWVTYGTFKIENDWAWRLPSLLQCVTSVFQGIIVLFGPESPRWLVGQGRREEALEMLIKYHGGGDRDSPLVEFEMAEIEATLEVEQLQRASSWLEFLRTRGNRRRLYIVATSGFCLQWAGNGLVSYFLPLVLDSVGITDSYTQLIINACTQVWSFLVAISVAMAIDKVGRRRLLLIAYIGMFFSYFVWTILAAITSKNDFRNKDMGNAIVFLIFVFFAFFHFTSPVMPAYVVEVMNFELRAKGVVIFQLGSNLASIFSGFTNPVALENIGWRYYIVYVCLLVLWTVVIWYGYPETKGLSLEEINSVFDGHDTRAGDAAYRTGVDGGEKAQMQASSFVEDA